MVILVRSSTFRGTHEQERPRMVYHGDFKSLMVPYLCDQIEGCIRPGVSVYASIPGMAEEKITPADNMYGIISAIDRGCDHIVVDVPGDYASQSYRIHFSIEEL